MGTTTRQRNKGENNGKEPWQKKSREIPPPKSNVTSDGFDQVSDQIPEEELKGKLRAARAVIRSKIRQQRVIRKTA